LDFYVVQCNGFVPVVGVKVCICLNQSNCHPEDGGSKILQISEQTHYTEQCKNPKDHPPHENPPKILSFLPENLLHFMADIFNSIEFTHGGILWDFLQKSH
jgi:hypothetical protein